MHHQRIWRNMSGTWQKKWYIRTTKELWILVTSLVLAEPILFLYQIPWDSVQSILESSFAGISNLYNIESFKNRVSQWLYSWSGSVINIILFVWCTHAVIIIIYASIIVNNNNWTDCGFIFITVLIKGIHYKASCENLTLS